MQHTKFQSPLKRNWLRSTSSSSPTLQYSWGIVQLHYTCIIHTVHYRIHTLSITYTISIIYNALYTIHWIHGEMQESWSTMNDIHSKNGRRGSTEMFWPQRIFYTLPQNIPIPILSNAPHISTHLQTAQTLSYKNNNTNNDNYNDEWLSTSAENICKKLISIYLSIYYYGDKNFTN